MPALRHGQKGRLCGGRKSSVERRLRSAGRSVPERSELEPTPPPPPLLRLPFPSPFASLQGMGGGRRRSFFAVAPVQAPGHASCCPGSGRAPRRPRPLAAPARAPPSAQRLVETAVVCPEKEAAPCPERGLSSGGQASATVRPEAQPFFFFFWRGLRWTGKRSGASL